MLLKMKARARSHGPAAEAAEVQTTLTRPATLRLPTSTATEEGGPNHVDAKAGKAP